MLNKFHNDRSANSKHKSVGFEFLMLRYYALIENETTLVVGIATQIQYGCQSPDMLWYIWDP